MLACATLLQAFLEALLAFGGRPALWCRCNRTNIKRDYVVSTCTEVDIA
jgi:hypothetical protein